MPDPTLESDSDIDLQRTKKKLDNDTLRKKVLTDARRAVRANSDWILAAREDYRFALGDQWSQEEKAILMEQRRPSLTINKIAVQVDVLSGYQRNNSSRIKVSPEGSEDKVFSETFDKALNYVDKLTALKHKLNQQFDDGLICGRGWMEIAINYDKDPLHGDLMFHPHSPFSVYKDPDGTEYDLSDSEYVVKIKRYTKSKLKALYPDKESVIDALAIGTSDIFTDQDVGWQGDETNYGLRADKAGPPLNRPMTAEGLNEAEGPDAPDSRTHFTLIEYWYKKYVKKWFVYDLENGRLSRFDTEAEANAKIEEQKKIFLAPDPATQQIDPMTAMPIQGTGTPDPELAQLANEAKAVVRTVPEIWVAAVCADQVLVHGISPLEPNLRRFPFFPFFSKWTPSAENELTRTRGLVRDLKDPQREVNKSRSQYLHIINTTANSGWVGDDDALSDEQWDQLKAFGSKPGHIIRKRAGSDLERIMPVPQPIAHEMMERMATENLKEVSGINADLLSIEDKTTSGRALALRIKQALTIVASTFENWKRTKQLIGEAIFDLMPEVFDAKKLSNVLGQRFMESVQLSAGQLQAFLGMVEDGQFDVQVSDASESPTLRAETFEQLLSMAQSGMQLPPDLLIEWSNIPNSAEVIQRIQAFQKQMMMAQGMQPPSSGGSNGSKPPKQPEKQGESPYDSRLPG